MENIQRREGGSMEGQSCKNMGILLSSDPTMLLGKINENDFDICVKHVENDKVGHYFLLCNVIYPK